MKKNYSIRTVTATPNLVSTVPLRTRTFKSLDTVIEKNVKELSYTPSYSEFSPEYFKEYYNVPTDSTDVLQVLKGQALSVFSELDSGGNIIDTIDFQEILDALNPLEPITFPLGLKKQIGNTHFMVGISDATFYPDHTEITIFVRIILGQAGQDGQQRQLFFGATGVRITKDGGLQGDANIALLGDYSIPIMSNKGALIFKGGFDLETGDIEDKTYVIIDCDGFKELKISAEVQFSREVIVPLTPENQIDNSTYDNTSIKKRVSTEIALTVANLSDILIEVNIPKFAMTSEATVQNEADAIDKAFIFEGSNAVFDFSETRNSENIVFPPGYVENHLDGEFLDLWKGVYIQSLTISLPTHFKLRSTPDAQRIMVNASNLIIDRAGVTGDFSADNVLPSFVASTWINASFNGAIVTPLTREATEEDALLQAQIANSNSTDVPQQNELSERIALQYIGLINPVINEYSLTVNVVENVPIPLDAIKSKATIYPDSYLTLEVSDGKFKPEALLHGVIDIGINNSNTTQSQTNTESTEDEKVNFEQIEFQGLFLSTESPKFSIESFGYSGTLKVKNFPVTINEIEFRTENNLAILEFHLNINLQENSISASAGLRINGILDESNDLTKWKYDSVELSSIDIDADFGTFQIQGSLSEIPPEEADVYGEGYSGNVTATFAGLGSENLTISVDAIFGKTDFRYWYVDGLVSNISIETGTGLRITGFGGGASYRMSKSGVASNSTASKANYIPDDTQGLGVKAMVLFASSGTNKLFNGIASFEMAFNSNGGLNRIGLYGEAHFLQDIDFTDPSAIIQETLTEVIESELNIPPASLEALKNSNLLEVAETIFPNQSAQLGFNAYAAIEFDFSTSTLHGNFDVYLDSPGGIIRGAGNENRLGNAVIHFEPGSWYIHIGHPDNRNGIKIGIGEFAIETGSYFLLGDNIPELPLPPQEVLDLIGGDLSYITDERDESMLADGRGLAFGMNFSIDTGDIKFLIFRARFQAGLGYDIMVKDYGEAQCEGSGQIGLNGWYASGQAYGYMEGSVSIRIRVFGFKKTIKIFSAGLGVLLQAKLPNPAWFRGYASGYFNVLGGLVKGSFRVKVEIGSQCDFVDDAPLGGLKIIADIIPYDGSNDVDVFTVPQVALNMRANRLFALEEDDGVNYYRISLDEFEITDQGAPIPGEVVWNDNDDLMSYQMEDVLPPEKNLQLKVSVTFEERTNGVWNVILDDDGQPARETEIRSFTTGTAPDYIPLSNIEYMYPVIDQQYVYKNEHPQAFIKLKTGQDYLFEANNGFDKVVYFDGNATLVSSPIITGTSYKMTLASVPEGESTESTTSESYDTQNIGEDIDIETKTVSIEGATINSEAIEMLSYDFTTSTYSTFSEKIAAKAPVDYVVEIVYDDVHSLHTISNATEPFDIVEIEGNEWSNFQPFFKIEADLTDDYFINIMGPLLYNDYPVAGLSFNRNTNILGNPPIHAMDLMTWYVDRAQNDPYNIDLKTRIPYRYHLTGTYKQDFLDIRGKMVDRYLNNPTQYADQIAQYNNIIFEAFPFMPVGSYNSKIKYVLPDGTVSSSSNFLFAKD